MAKLHELNAAPKRSFVRFKEGTTAVETNLTTSDGIKWYVWELAEPVIVACSTEPAIEKQQVDQLHIRETDLDADFDKDDKGLYAYWMETPEKGDPVKREFVADFLLGPEIYVYQQVSARAWLKGERKSSREDRRSSLINKINKGGGKKD